MREEKRDPLMSITSVLAGHVLDMRYEKVDVRHDPFFDKGDPVYLLKLEDRLHRHVYARGYADVQALKKKYHQKDLYESEKQGLSEINQVCYALLEKARIEYIGAQRWCGVRYNLNILFKRIFPFNRMLPQDLMHKAAYIQMMYVRVRMHFFKTPVLKKYAPIVQHDEAFFAQYIAPYLGDLKECALSQARYSVICKKMLSAVVWDQEEGVGLAEGAYDKNMPTPQGHTHNKQVVQDDEMPHDGSDSTIVQTEQRVGGDRAHTDLGFDLSFLRDPLSVGNGKTLPFLVEDQSYRVFTKAYDELLYAKSLPDALKKEMTARFEEKAPDRRLLVKSLYKKLDHLLKVRTYDGDVYGMHDGLLDLQKLARIISPSHDFYKNPTSHLLKETAVSILVDNSGSMRGTPILSACLTSHVLSQVLEQCGIQNEVLGFTTRTWNGGRAKQQWITEGEKPFPGRLNEMCYIVYKEMFRSYGKSYRDICTMLDHDRLKENIDGEALLWAAKRLERSSCKRKILIVISDGAPVDDATLAANGDPYYADRHLRAVIKKIEKQSSIQLAAVGIGHDVTHYYKEATTIHHAEHLVEAGGDLLVNCFRRIGFS